MNDFSLFNIRIPVAGGTERTSIAIEDGRIASIGGRVDGPGIDGASCLALPGIVDLHGDAFERQLMPRPGVHFDADLALLDTDRQLISNGITTAYHGVTYSWEPGLRSRAAGKALIETIERMRARLICDTRLHMRWEIFNLDAEDEIAAWIVAGKIDLLAFNDHTPGMMHEAGRPDKLMKYVERSGLNSNEFAILLEEVYGRRADVPGAVGRLAHLAAEAAIPMASHDDDTPDVRRRYARVGCAISEFPKNEDTARCAREAGHEVVMGAPNVVRGGSHLSAVSAADLVARDLCTILTSDYYYPSLAQATFRLVRDGVRDLASAWKLISEYPARAAGLDDRGILANGKRADIVLIDDSAANLPRIVGTIANGRPSLFGTLDPWGNAGQPALRRAS